MCIRDRHIIDPRSKEAGPGEGRLAAWSIAPDAITADASSTAFMMLSDEEISDYCLANEGTAAIILPHVGSDNSSGQSVKSYGQWDEVELPI